MHALSTHDQRHLLLDDLDHSRATLLARRTGKPVHTVYLDELTYRLARQWLAERHRRWPTTTSPYLLVTAHTATDDIQPPVSIQAINKPLRAHGHQAGRLRVDRILNEAQHTDDPLQLIRLFGLSPRTAMNAQHLPQVAGAGAVVAPRALQLHQSRGRRQGLHDRGELRELVQDLPVNLLRQPVRAAHMQHRRPRTPRFSCAHGTSTSSPLTASN
ncbi:hypothetical protein ACH4E5_37480 [Streptomyces afghaniensis]|uniref:hypothetical protein n=1 Tax=Streptomyces afghaniensis TaxID=66865 RepID=UPI003798C95A